VGKLEGRIPNWTSLTVGKLVFRSRYEFGYSDPGPGFHWEVALNFEAQCPIRKMVWCD